MKKVFSIAMASIFIGGVITLMAHGRQTLDMFEAKQKKNMKYVSAPNNAQIVKVLNNKSGLADINGNPVVSGGTYTLYKGNFIPHELDSPFETTKYYTPVRDTLGNEYDVL